MTTIFHRYSGAILFSTIGSLRWTVEAAVRAGVSLCGANLQDADLGGVDLSNADLSDADLRGANFTDANLSHTEFRDADLTGVKGLPVVAAVPGLEVRILKAIENGSGRLEMSHWHGLDGACGTVHCLAGWAVHFARAEVAELEGKTSTFLVGRLVYEASYPGRALPDFFASSQKALADLRARVATEAT